jgi:hypothetical protein
MRITVASEQELETRISQYVLRGFVPVNRTAVSVMLVKRKEFNNLIAIIGLLFCGVGLVIYAIVYAFQRDQYVEIVVAAQQELPGAASTTQFSADGRWWWDGSEWRDAERVVPPGMQRSPDGQMWFDGKRWRPVPAEEPAGEAQPPDTGLPGSPGAEPAD